MAEDKPSLAEQILSQFGSRSFLEQARMGARYFVGKNKWRAVDWVRMCYREAVTTHWIPALDAFKPQLIYISAGFDGHREDDMGNLGLVATLEILTREFTQQTDIEVSCALESVALSATAELMVFRLVQEALTNITKYAGASHVWVNLATRDSQVEISVRDDGRGFDTAVPSKSAYGLMGMRFRVQAEGGVLMLESAPGRGALIRAILPPTAFPRTDI